MQGTVSRVTLEISQAWGPRDILQIRSGREQETSTGRREGSEGVLQVVLSSESPDMVDSNL